MDKESKIDQIYEDKLPVQKKTDNIKQTVWKNEKKTISPVGF